MKALITVGCTTDHGGIIKVGNSSFKVDGKAVHLDGMTHYRPKCKVQSVAQASCNGFIKVHGKSIVAENDTSSCGAKFNKLSSRAVMSSQTTTRSIEKMPIQIPNNTPLFNDQDLNSHWSSPPLNLTEEEKLLTQEECKMIILHVWGDLAIQQNKLNQFPKLSTKDRSYITHNIYFSCVEKDEDMSIITSMINSFGSLTSKAALAMIDKTIVKDIAEMKVKSQAGRWWNNKARQKYFKVGWSENPVDRFKDVNMSILLTLKSSYKAEIYKIINLAL